MPASLGSMSFNDRHLYNDLISVWLSLARFRQNCTVPFALETSTKLLHQFDVLSMPRVLLFAVFITSLASFRGACSVYATLLEVHDLFNCHLSSINEM